MSFKVFSHIIKVDSLTWRTTSIWNIRLSSEACAQSLSMQIQRMPLSVFYLCWCCLLIKRLVRARRALKEAQYYTPPRSPLFYVNICSFYSLLTFNLPVVQFYSFCSFAVQQDNPLLFERYLQYINTGGNLFQLPVPIQMYPYRVSISVMNEHWLSKLIFYLWQLY